MAEHYDLLIGGGTLIDGTGSPARTADLILREDGHNQLPADGPLPGRLLRGGHA
jgi:N-acyl-D-aspartate/D-glutamate deacylase